MSFGLSELIILGVIATIGAAGLFTLLLRMDNRRTRPNLQLGRAGDGPVFLFQDKDLIDATPDALAMIAPHVQKMSEYEATLHVLGAHFINLEDVLAAHDKGHVRVDGEHPNALSMHIEREGPVLRIAVTDEVSNGPTKVTDMLEHDVRLAELSMMRELTKHTPQLIWQENGNGRLIWANQAYLSFSDRLRTGIETVTPTWPSKSVFPDLTDATAHAGSTSRRVAVTLPDKSAEHWFDVTTVAQQNGFLHFATDANAAVRADRQRHNFVQTLGKTFAELSTGLAIFDKRRQLAMFNPALHELTRLPIEFLSSRPSIDTVLDRLRETRILPEPKNYASWREQFTALEAEAREGTYCEVWELPDGQTYRITGRPHPDGAFALLFEDISAEISLTRRFRSDIETGQAVLDTLGDAIAVFSSTGSLVMSNKAYADLWDTAEPSYHDQRALQTELETWRGRCTPTRMWSEMRDFIYGSGTRKTWADDAILDDGRHIRCHANPIAGGMTMVRFDFAPPKTPVISKLTMSDPALLSAKR
ncbi:PAS-domain containing protein [Yoonia sp. BS5-3]|uniref:PAS-domain containing protein n=1 Tax=Yoonia phaeophyticola TaxID=3137369 RepID=A0ABZ2V539_9RHOB